MTRTEKKKNAQEKREIVELKNTIRCIEAQHLIGHCQQCEDNKIITFENRIEYLCKKKSRKNIIQTEKTLKIGFYPYGEVNGMCPFLTFMVLEQD